MFVLTLQASEQHSLGDEQVCPSWRQAVASPPPPSGRPPSGITWFPLSPQPKRSTPTPSTITKRARITTSILPACRADSPANTVTQMHQARNGVITDQMRHVAHAEHLDPELIRSEVASGRMIIPAGNS